MAIVLVSESLLIRTSVILDLGSHPNLIASAKTLFPNKVMFTGVTFELIILKRGHHPVHSSMVGRWGGD